MESSHPFRVGDPAHNPLTELKGLPTIVETLSQGRIATIQGIAVVVSVFEVHSATGSLKVPTPYRQSALLVATEATIISVMKSDSSYRHDGRITDVMLCLCYIGLILNATATFTTFAAIDILSMIPFQASRDPPSPFDDDNYRSGIALLKRYGTGDLGYQVLEFQRKGYLFCT